MLTYEFQVAKRLGIPVNEAQRLVRDFLHNFPKVEDFIEKTKRCNSSLLCKP
jgi:DNA polymerase I-like protein with 3'-5' exonuclease and polymerase domains